MKAIRAIRASTYGTTFLDLKAWGPTVIESPPGSLCVVDDFWFRYVADMGIAGPDKGQGGKYLYLPPDHQGEVPDGYHTYHNAAACRGCPARAQCTKSPFRKLLISIHHAVVVRSRERLAADPAAMRTRASLVEHPFSTIKDRHGYGGLLCRGIKLAAAEMGLSAWAYNFTRVTNLVGLDVLLGAIRGRNTPQPA